MSNTPKTRTAEQPSIDLTVEEQIAANIAALEADKESQK